MEEKKFRYSYEVTTNILWCSFDYGTVEASNYKEARKKAINELKYKFDKANDALKHCENTQGYTFHFNEKKVNIYLIPDYE